jgi:peptidoglycan-associated lipoprotein
MKEFALKRFSIVLLLALAFLAFGCSKNVPAPAAAPPPPPPPPPPAPTVTLSVDRNTITAGQSVTLNYTSTNATSVAIDPGVGSVQPVGSGSRQVTPGSTTTYRATASGPGGNAQSAAVNVTVNAAPPPPAPVTAPAPTPTTRTLSPDELFAQAMAAVLFDYDRYEIRPDQEERLLSMATWLKQNPSFRFRIEGNADERGSQEYNIALGDERASSVMRFLSTQGVAENRMTTVSYGEERPVCRDPNETCWQQNRRAAFVRIP